FGGRIEGDSKTDAFQSYCFTGLGPKYRAHPLAIAIANASLKSIDVWIAARQARLGELTEYLSELPGLRLPETHSGCSRGAFYGYRAMNVPGESGLPTSLLIRLLRDEGVSVSSEWYQLLHRQPLYSGADAFEQLTGAPWPYSPRWQETYDDED